MSSGRRKGPHSEDLNDIFSIMMLAASNTIENDDALENVSHGICEMFSLFTFKELATLQRDNRDFFDFMQALFYVLGHSDSKDSKKFISICRKRLDPKVNKLMNSGTPNTSMIMNQLGGARFGHGSIVLIFMVIWALICSDLLANPGTAITMSILSRIALSYSGIPWLKSAVMDYFKVEKQVEYPLAYAQGHAAIPLTNREGADGAAFASLSARGIELDAILDKNMLIASESHVEGFSRIQNLVRCADSGTCSEASDAIIGAALRPLKAADDARPRVSAEQIAQQGMLKKLEGDLSSERGKWSIWDRDEAAIIVLMETIAAKRAEIAAMDKMAGLAATLPSLERVGDVVGIVSAISADALDQVTPSSGRLNSPILRLPGRRLSPVKVAKANELALTVPTKPNRAVNVLTEYRAPRSISSVALTAIGIRNFTVRVTDLAAQYPGAEIDLRTVKAFSDSYQLLAAAQQLVGAEITVNTATINALVDRVFSGMGEEAGETTSEIAVALANTPVPKRSAGRKAITALVTEAAAEQAILNARTEKDITSVKISKILDGNIQANMRNMLEVLTGQLMSMSYPGGRKVAEKDARAAIDISRLFGVKPNLDTMDYAHVVFSCNTGAPCEKKPYSELRDRAALLREMGSWGAGKRFQHVKWNMIFSLLLLLPAGLAAEAALLTIVGIAGMPGRFATWGVEKGQQKERLEMAAAEAKARREQEEAELLHRQRMTALAAAPQHMRTPGRTPGRTGTPSRWGTLPPAAAPEHIRAPGRAGTPSRWGTLPPAAAPEDIRTPGRAGTPSRWGTLLPAAAPPPALPLIDATTAASMRRAQETRNRLVASLADMPHPRASSLARPSRFGPPITPYEGGRTRRIKRRGSRGSGSRSRR